MNRERAETFLRLLAEGELREWAVSGPAGPAFTGMPTALPRAAWALTVIGAVEEQTAEAILADIDLALDARRRPETLVAAIGGPPGGLPVPRRFAGARMPRRLRSPTPGPARTRTGPDRYVPIGRTIWFHDETISGELDLMSYLHTATGARLIAAWHTRDPIGSRPRGVPPLETFTVADDRGKAYDLLFSAKGRRESACDLGLHPEPPRDARWLDVTAPGEQTVRIGLGEDHGKTVPAAGAQEDGGAEARAADRAGADGGAAADDGAGADGWGGTEVSPGEQLLNRIADRLLTLAAQGPAGGARANPAAGALGHLAAGLGTTIAALQAAEALPARSALPGQLATLCASLGVCGHGITVDRAPDLPEPWLSVLAHHLRRKPGPAPAGEGFGGLAAALPEFDGITLILLGLHNTADGSWVNALARGRLPGSSPARCGSRWPRRCRSGSGTTPAAGTWPSLAGPNSTARPASPCG